MHEPPHIASLCVLASGSAGNASVLLVEGEAGPRIMLIDAGLSPRRTRRLLAGLGLTFDHLCGVALTHLDHDHWHGGWLKAIPAHVRIWAHKRHAARGRRTGALPAHVCGFEDAFDPEGFDQAGVGVRAFARIASHDELGVAAYRFEFRVSRGSAQAPPLAAALGFATDVGRMRDHLIEHLRRVDVLAIESNYCPCLQEASPRPWFLKRRITGGAGHLSNEEALAAVRLIEPRTDVILLHLSRECNDPELVSRLHDGAPYRCTVTSQVEPSNWVYITPGHRRADATGLPAVQLPLFGIPAVRARNSHDGVGSL